MAEQLSLFDLFGSDADAALTPPKKKESKKNSQQHQNVAEEQVQEEITSEKEIIEAKVEPEAPVEALAEEPRTTEDNEKAAIAEIEAVAVEEQPLLAIASDDEIIVSPEEHVQQYDTSINESFNDNDVDDSEDRGNLALKQEDIVVHKKRGRKSFKEIDNEIDLVSIPVDEELFKKQYYPISTVAKWFRVNASLLRFWENEFSILKPRKTRKGDRLFRPEDIKNLQVIYHLLRQRKFTIEGAKKYLKANKQTADTHLQIIQSLNQFKSFLLELKANLGE